MSKSKLELMDDIDNAILRHKIHIIGYRSVRILVVVAAAVSVGSAFVAERVVEASGIPLDTLFLGVVH